jgi:hypothetical protein
MGKRFEAIARIGVADRHHAVEREVSFVQRVGGTGELYRATAEAGDRRREIISREVGR